MENILTACLPLLLLAALIHGLKHGFYILHIFLTAAQCWLAQYYFPAPAMLFSPHAITLAIAAHLVSINLVTWLAYSYDKKASITKKWRIPERTLHAFALIGGTPAAWLAQKKLRHKNKKQSFQTLFWLIFLLQTGWVIYVFAAMA